MAVQQTTKKEKLINSEFKESKQVQKFNKRDFVEIEYTGFLKENNLIFDTTNEETAKKANLYSKETKYGPKTICIGEGYLIQGLEEDILKNTQAWSDVIESYIRKYPELWVWMHPRWKTKPQQ